MIYKAKHLLKIFVVILIIIIIYIYKSIQINNEYYNIKTMLTCSSIAENVYKYNALEGTTCTQMMDLYGKYITGIDGSIKDSWGKSIKIIYNDANYYIISNGKDSIINTSDDIIFDLKSKMLKYNSKFYTIKEVQEKYLELVTKP